MPHIVKWPYIERLLPALAEAKAAGLSDAEFVEQMNAPVPTGETETVVVEPSMEDLTAAIREAKDMPDLQARVAEVTEERPVMGPSPAEVIGIRRVYWQNVHQLRGYIEKGMTEQEIRDELDAHRERAMPVEVKA